MDITQTAPDACVIEWSVRLPNGHERSLEMEDYPGWLLDPDTLRHAFAGVAARGLAWGVMFRNIMPAEGLAEATDQIIDLARSLALQLQQIQQQAPDLAAGARARGSL